MSRGLDAMQEVRAMISYYKEFVKCKLPTKADAIDFECLEELNIIEEELKKIEDRRKS